MKFQSKTYGQITLGQIAQILRQRLEANPSAKFVLAVGSDSQNTFETRMVQVIVLHQVGTGGIYFYRLSHLKRIPSLREKLMKETESSLEVASQLLSEIEQLFYQDHFDYTNYNLKLEFHCDLSSSGKSGQMIKEVIGWVKGVLQESYLIYMKPEAFAASCVADRVSKPSFIAS